MGRYVGQRSSFVSNLTQNTQDSNTSRFACRCIYTTPGTYTFTVPSGVTSVTAVAVGPGGCANSIAKLSEKYIYQLCQTLCTTRTVCTCCPCPGCQTLDPYGQLCASTYSCQIFCLGGYTCFQQNYNTVYSRLDYAVFDSAPGGGYSEKQITTTPGATFTVVVGCNGGNNYSCVNGQLCATGPTITNGTGISTSTQYICIANPSEGFYCCYFASCGYQCEYYTKAGLFCYVKDKTANSCILAGCGFGGDINRTGGFGYQTKSFCFPLGFDSSCLDQRPDCVCICTGCVGQASPFLGFRRTIAICSCIATDPASTGSLAICPAVCCNTGCLFPSAASCNVFRGAWSNCFSYCDTICRLCTTCGDACVAWNPIINFMVPGSYCKTCLSSSCTNFIGIVTAVSTGNLSVLCNMSGGSSSGSPCYNGVYQPSSTSCTLTTSTTDLPTITGSACGRPIFSSFCSSCTYLNCCLNCYTYLDTKLYSDYSPCGPTYIANSGCNPCNCSDIGCFYCTCKFDPMRNMWGIISGPCCFAYGATGIGNSLTLCDPLRWARSIGGCHGCSCIHCYYGSSCTCNFFSGCCPGTLSHYGTALTSISCLWNCYYPNTTGYCLGGCTITYIAPNSNSVCATMAVTRACCAPYWQCTNYWPTTTCWNCFGGTCCPNIPAFNLYEIFCDSTGKCISFCSTCTDAGKQFQTQLGEQGLEAIRAHFSPCTCSVKCFGSYCDWPCYFASTGAGTTIACGGNSPLVPRQELTVCDPRYTANNFHSIYVTNIYNFSTAGVCNVWGGTGSDPNCVWCNSFATAVSSLSRGYSIGSGLDAGAGIAYTGVTSPSGNTCCYNYFVGSSTCTSYTEGFAIKDFGGGGGSYGNPCSTKIICTGRCSVVIMSPSGGPGWGDYDTPLVVTNPTENTINQPRSTPKFNTWFDVLQAKGSGARGAVCLGSYCYAPAPAGPGGGGLSGYTNDIASTCVFGGAVCSGTAGPGGGAGGQGVPGTGMVVIYWNP